MRQDRGWRRILITVGASSLQGIRRGIDVVRALSLGATAVAVGRPVLFGSVMGGAQGAQSVIEHLRDELRAAMLLGGAANVTGLSRDYLKV
ncbi:alpha-hydroxy-acid oxidizing protein [Agrobacterium sp. MCAB5]|uniref:alpha-hydroxy-acid oxidizing protein n=1 Tax=Agrobacterium sp. MCAB5 TaxID=3233042 RepID=UPI003F925663